MEYSRSNASRRPAPFGTLIALSTPRLWLAAAVGLVGLLLANSVLNAFYARSRFPVPFAEGQLTFDAALLEQYYAVMQDAGTLDVYVVTQLVDFGFMAANLVLGLPLLALVAKGLSERSVLGPVSRGAIWLGVAFPALDALENLTSFVLLTRPDDLPGPLVILYSTLAALKFAAAGLAGTWLLVGGGLALALRRPRR
jgi:hypothetical protein